MSCVGRDIASSRKRRRENEDVGIYKLYNPEKQHDVYLLDQSNQPFLTRKILPLHKRTKLSTDERHPHDTPQHHHRRRSSNKTLQDQPGLGNRAPAPRTSGASLEPCHICHRKPTKQSDLDGFAGCHSCGQRTCFVCIRECQGWNVEVRPVVLSEQERVSRSFCMDDVDDVNEATAWVTSGDSDGGDQTTAELPDDHYDGKRRKEEGWDTDGHRAVVCSRCCVERGAEGEVVCLGCLSGMEAG